MFTATYTGPAIAGLDISALLAGLKFTVTPPLSGEGTYQITASGTAPDGYTFQIQPGTMTVLDGSPRTLPTQTNPFMAETPVLLPALGSGPGNGLLAPVNSMGLFQIQASEASNGFGASFTGFPPDQTPLAQFSFFSPQNEHPDTYSAGAKP